MQLIINLSVSIFFSLSFVVLLTTIIYRSLLSVLLVAFVGIVFGILARYSFGRKLLLKYPKLFSLGFISHEGPSEESMKNTKFSITFFGQGWPSEEALSEPTDQHTTLPSKKIVTRVTGTNPGKFNTNELFMQWKCEMYSFFFFSWNYRIRCNLCRPIACSQNNSQWKGKIAIDWRCPTSWCLFRKVQFDFKLVKEWFRLWSYFRTRNWNRWKLKTLSMHTIYTWHIRVVSTIFWWC